MSTPTLMSNRETTAIETAKEAIRHKRILEKERGEEVVWSEMDNLHGHAERRRQRLIAVQRFWKRIQEEQSKRKTPLTENEFWAVYRAEMRPLKEIAEEVKE